MLCMISQSLVENYRILYSILGSSILETINYLRIAYNSDSEVYKERPLSIVFIVYIAVNKEEEQL